MDDSSEWMDGIEGAGTMDECPEFLLEGNGGGEDVNDDLLLQESDDGGAADGGSNWVEAMGFDSFENSQEEPRKTVAASTKTPTTFPDDLAGVGRADNSLFEIPTANLDGNLTTDTGSDGSFKHRLSRQILSEASDSQQAKQARPEESPEKGFYIFRGKRIYVPCVACEQRNIKCIKSERESGDNLNDPPPCVRCRQESEDCYFFMTGRKRKHRNSEEDPLEGTSRQAKQSRPNQSLQQRFYVFRGEPVSCIPCEQRNSKCIKSERESGDNPDNPPPCVRCRKVYEKCCFSPWGTKVEHDDGGEDSLHAYNSIPPKVQQSLMGTPPPRPATPYTVISPTTTPRKKNFSPEETFLRRPPPLSQLSDDEADESKDLYSKSGTRAITWIDLTVASDEAPETKPKDESRQPSSAKGKWLDKSSRAPVPSFPSTAAHPAPESELCITTESVSAGRYRHRTRLWIEGDLESMAQSWSEEEWKLKRRIVIFETSKSRNITINFRPSATDKPPTDKVCISCVYWKQKEECFITVSDLIFLLGPVLKSDWPRFSTKEMSWILKEIESYRPLKVFEGKRDSDELFKVVMSSPTPETGDVERDVKVLPWKNLSSVLRNLFEKYSNSPPSSQSKIEAGDEDLIPEVDLGGVASVGVSSVWSRNMSKESLRAQKIFSESAEPPKSPTIRTSSHILRPKEELGYSYGYTFPSADGTPDYSPYLPPRNTLMPGPAYRVMPHFNRTVSGHQPQAPFTGLLTPNITPGMASTRADPAATSNLAVQARILFPVIPHDTGNTFGPLPENPLVKPLGDAQQERLNDSAQHSIPKLENGPSEEPGNTSSSTETTDITEPQIDNDFSDDDSGDYLSDDPDLDDGTKEERILHPKAYFKKLEDLERNIYKNSFIHAYGNTQTSLSSDSIEHHNSPGTRSISIDEITSCLENSKPIIRHIKNIKSGTLLLLLECHIIISRVCQNLRKLQASKYCTDSISLMSIERMRKEVARTVEINIENILKLGENFKALFEDISQDIIKGQLHSESNVYSTVSKYMSALQITSRCTSILPEIGLIKSVDGGALNHLFLSWKAAVQMLELGLLSYTGAHVQRFDLELVKTNTESFHIPQKFIYADDELIAIPPILSLTRPRLILRRRRLRCLDDLLGSQRVWIFHENFDKEENRLYLSTSIKILSDLWGPCWKILKPSENDPIQRSLVSSAIAQFNIGNGAILRWKDESKSDQAVFKYQEKFCHWVSFKNWDDQEIQRNQKLLLDSSERCFSESNQLLIGATNGLGLAVNENCTLSSERLLRVKTTLLDQQALRAPKTFRPKRYLDSHAIQVAGSAMGIVSAAGTITYKRRVGHTMKDALLERWRHNLRNPMDLEAATGVEVSLCTRNARRRRLLQLLASQTMRNYLRGISFKWVSEDCENAYFRALRSPKAFRKFWKEHIDLRQNVGDAITDCLDALQETGITEGSGELRALWVESFDNEGDSDGESDEEDEQQLAKPSISKTCSLSSSATLIGNNDFLPVEEWVVTLFRSEHTWTGFLQDSEETLTMAIIGNPCLDFARHADYGRRCSNNTPNHKGFPVLETSLLINESILKKEKITQEKVDSGRRVIWNAKQLSKGTKFSLGDHGMLKVLTSAARNCPAIMEWSSVKSETLQEAKNVLLNATLLGKGVERHHCEYTRGAWEVKPLPVLVLSKSTKTVFS